MLHVWNLYHYDRCHQNNHYTDKMLSDEAELLYKASGEYAPQADRGVLWCDKDINIDWEIDFEPILSEKDKVQPLLKDINKKELI